MGSTENTELHENEDDLRFAHIHFFDEAIPPIALICP